MNRFAGWMTSLSVKYAILFALLVALPVVAVSAYLLKSSYDQRKRDLVRLQQEKAQALAEAIDETLTGVISRLQRTHVADRPHAERVAVLDQLLHASDPVPVSVFYLNSERQNVLTEPEVIIPQEPPTLSVSAFRAARADVFISRLASNAEWRSATFTIATYEAYGDGVLAERLFVSTLLQRTGTTRFGNGGYAYAVDANGRPIQYPPNAPTERTATSERFVGVDFTTLPQVRKALERPGTGSTTGQTLTKRSVLSAWATVPTTAWRVFVEQPTDVAIAPLRGQIWRTALLLAAFTAAAIVLSILLARRLVRPIRRMRVAAARIGAGAYDERIELEPPRTVAIRGRLKGHTHEERVRSIVAIEPVRDHHRQDDLGALADDFNRMAASLQESHAKLEQKVEERTRELQAALEQLAEKTRELEIASKHKSEFLANMSHELRTPLNAIVGFSQVLKQKLFGAVNDKQEEYLDDILSSADHLLSLINDILDLSKVEAGQVELEVAPFSLREALERGVVMVREGAMKNGIQLDLEVDPEIGVVEADERRIRQIVFNLLSNAVKFSPAGAHIGVSAARDNGVITVAVSDDGPGIAPEDQERIFEEFQQAEHDGPRPEGTGLGLALSRRLVELHGGRIWVESQAGAGSTFAFTIPLKSR